MKADDVVIAIGASGVAMYYAGIGALFISRVDGAIFVEAIAINDAGEPRPVVQRRHVELMRRAREIFGDRIEHHDPLNLSGFGTRRAAS